MKSARRLGWLLLLIVGTLSPGVAGHAAESPVATGSFQGQLLVAEPELADPNFDHTVVLLLHHGPDGAQGLVINRPYGTAPTAELLRRLGQPRQGVQGETRFFYGGPVQPEIGMVLHSTDYASADTRRVTADLAVTSNPAILADIAERKGPAHALPVLGYAGWAAGQLESELAQGAWFTIAADQELIFAPDADRIWERALARKGVEL
jgi:putative transcriptional regulator